MRKEQRLRRRKDFGAVYRRGRIQSNRLLALRVLPNDQAVSRFGFVAAKVVGGAVTRNRVKRRLREVVRRLAVRGGYDVVIGARKPCADASFADLHEALQSLLGRAGVLTKGAE
jgi:ribonuclease P protein component